MNDQRKTVLPDYVEARGAVGRAWLDVGAARVELQKLEAAARRASAHLKTVCPHEEGFTWNGFGGHNDVTYECYVCGTSKADAKK